MVLILQEIITYMSTGHSLLRESRHLFLNIGEEKFELRSHSHFLRELSFDQLSSVSVDTLMSYNPLL